MTLPESNPRVDILLAGASRALQAQDWSGALGWLDQAPTSQLGEEPLLDRVLCLRMLGRLTEALEAVQPVLMRNPTSFVALMTKGALLERLGRRGAAVDSYRHALAVSPPESLLPPPLAAQAERARGAVQAHADALAAHLRASLASIRQSFAGETLDRFDEALEIYAGRARVYAQEPLLLHYPRLPAIPFYERRDFRWLTTLEAATAVIADELASLLVAHESDFAPYIAFPPGVPVNQWAELDHSRRWSSFFLWRDGKRQAGACELCPRTAALLATLPMADQPGFAPTAMFSRLEPRTRIPPHTGSTNARLLVHLPLLLPGPARFRVGGVTREWRLGEAWVFDDTIEHEAWNDADEARTILIFDIWNPLLSPAERTLVTAMMMAKQTFGVAEAR